MQGNQFEAIKNVWKTNGIKTFSPYTAAVTKYGYWVTSNSKGHPFLESITS